MKNIFLNNQVDRAKEVYSYFFIKLFFSIIKIIFRLSILLLLSGFFNNTFVNIIALLYTFYSLFNIYFVCVYYFNITDDIKNTLGYDKLSFEIDLNLIHADFIKGVIKYGI